MWQDVTGLIVSAFAVAGPIAGVTWFVAARIASVGQAVAKVEAKVDALAERLSDHLSKGAVGMLLLAALFAQSCAGVTACERRGWQGWGMTLIGAAAGAATMYAKEDRERLLATALAASATGWGQRLFEQESECTEMAPPE